MSVLYLVRHGQAAFGTENYDRLTATGLEQCRQLGRHWRGLGRSIPLIFSGELERQLHSAATFASALAGGETPAPEVVRMAGLAEYDHARLVLAYGQDDPARAAPVGLERDRKAFHQHLERALRAWVAGEIEGFEPFGAFRDRCVAALRAVMDRVGRGGTAVVFGSAGSLAAAIQPIIGLGDWDLLRLKLNFYNTGVSRLLFSSSGAVVESINSIAHLEQPGLQHLITQR